MIHIAWLKVHDTVRDHPKTRRLARGLGVSRHEAIGVLVCLWLWGQSNADRDGFILNATAEDIADGVMYRGTSSGASGGQLLDSLIVSGWIDVEGDALRLHDWDTWQSEWYRGIDAKKADAARKRAERAAKRPAERPVERPADVRTQDKDKDDTTSELPPGSPDKQCFAIGSLFKR